jgi:hypothetical protein
MGPPMSPTGRAKWSSNISWGCGSASRLSRLLSQRLGRMSRPSMSSPPSRPPHRQLRQSWWCERMAKGSRWCSRPPDSARAPGQRAETRQEVGSHRHRPLYHPSLPAHSPGGGGCPAAGPWSPGAGRSSPACRQRTASHRGGKGGRHEPAGTAGRPARWATYPGARGPH